MDSRNEALERLRKEVSGLAVDDILALCYSLHQHELEKQQLDRLRFYLDVLRTRGGERAQFASCLICFDLARQGDESFQHEFVYLADTIRRLAQSSDFVDTLIGGDPYLVYIWDLCQAQLAEMDPRFADTSVAAQSEGAPVASLDLLSDADFQEDLPDFAGDVDDAKMWLRFDEAVEAFLGGQMGVPVYDPTAGYRLHSGQDLERIEAFLRELESLRDFVRPSRGFLALTLLFYGTHIRSKSIFGAINQRKQDLLREGIKEFLVSAPMLWEIVGVLGPIHADPDVWDKAVDVIADYLRWMHENPENALAGPEAYDAVGRLVARDQGRWRR